VSPAVEELEGRWLLDGSPGVAPPPFDQVHAGRHIGQVDSLAAQVRSLYRKYLRQEPSGHQLRRALSFLHRGRTLLAFEARLLGSEQYFHQRGKDKNKRFLRVLARDVLDRSFTDGERLRFRADLRNGVSRTAVARAVLRMRDNPTPTEPEFFALDPTVATTMDAAARFLYDGTNPRQVGVAPGTINAVRVAVLRGRVLDRDGEALAGVEVTILSHPEFGHTLTQADGWFDMAVNGGGPLVVDYKRDGLLPVQRQIDVPWQDYALVPDVVMVPLDSRVTTIDLTSSAPIQVARGSVVTDPDGTRQNTLFFAQGTQATMTLPDGNVVPLTTLAVRATEYSVGPSGPDAMPAGLPPSSGYTYCVELSVDAALAAGATSVNFDRTVYDYVENFLDFPVGTPVPVGSYDRVRALWVA
jgi:hypothetical protein